MYIKNIYKGNNEGHGSSYLCVNGFNQGTMIQKEFQQTARPLKMCKQLFYVSVLHSKK